MSSSRKAKINVHYKGKNITDQIAQYINSLTYTDVASGSSDSITLKLIDRDKKWMGGWHPVKGDSIQTVVYLHNWYKSGTKKTFDCGVFVVDDLDYGGRPLYCNVGATSVPQHEAFHSTSHSKTWKKVTLEEIAKEVASRSGMKLHYEAATISIASVEQNKQKDSKFLYSLCSEYGLAMKIFCNKIIIFDEETYEKKPIVATIKESEVEDGWHYNTSLSGTYTGAKASYTVPKSSKTHTVKIGSGSRILEVNVTASSASDAERKAKAKLHEENKTATTINFSIRAKPWICSSSCIKLEEFRHLNGKYYVDKVKHNINSNSSYNMDIEAHLIGG